MKPRQWIQARHSVFFKLFVVFLVLISLPVVLTETFMYGKWTDATRDVLSDQFAARFRQATEDLQFALADLEKMNDLIYEEAQRENDLPLKLLAGRRETDDLRNDTYMTGFFDSLSKRIFQQYRGQATFAFFAMDGRLLYQHAQSDMTLPVRRYAETYAETDWFRLMRQNGAKNTVLIGHAALFGETSAPDAIVFGQVIRSSDNLQHLGVSVLTVPVTVFDRLWSGGDGQPLFRVQAKDATGRIIYTNMTDPQTPAAPADASLPAIAAAIAPYGITVEADVRERYLVQPYLASIVQLNLVLILLTVVCLLLFILYAIYKTKPIYTLARKMSRAKQGDFHVQMNYSSHDELGMLTRAFNEMTAEINLLFREKEQEYNEKLSFLRHSLETRINPHFIYNMLDLIQYQVGEQEPETISDMIISLSRILRYTIDKPGVQVTVEQEMQWLGDYLALQRRLYGGEVDVVAEVDDAARSCKVDKLILQPLIENCFEHGFAARDRRYRLDIRIGRDGDRLVTQLEDDGAGFAEPLELVLDRASRDTLRIQGVGLTVTAQRFLLVEDERTIVIASAPGRGTRIELRQTARE